MLLLLVTINRHFKIKKIFLIEHKCKAPIGCLTFIFYQKYFL